MGSVCEPLKHSSPSSCSLSLEPSNPSEFPAVDAAVAAAATVPAAAAELVRKHLLGLLQALGNQELHRRCYKSEFALGWSLRTFLSAHWTPPPTPALSAAQVGRALSRPPQAIGQGVTKPHASRYIRNMVVCRLLLEVQENQNSIPQ